MTSPLASVDGMYIGSESPSRLQRRKKSNHSLARQARDSGTNTVLTPPKMPTSSGAVQPITQPSPKPRSVQDFLAGDEVYQQSLRGGQRSLADFLSDLTRRKGEAQTSFDQTQGYLEEDRDRQLARMKDEFASRGLLHSGLFAREQGEFEEDFTSQLERMQQSLAMLFADLASQETNFRRQQDLQQEALRQDALNRRAARFNIA